MEDIDSAEELLYCSNIDKFESIEIKFKRKKKNGFLAITSLIIKWLKREDRNIHNVFLEVKNNDNNTSYHAILDCEKRSFNLPLDISNDLFLYNILVYGLSKHECDHSTYYKVLVQADDNLDNLLKSGKLDTKDGIELIDHDQLSLKTSTSNGDLTSEELCQFSLNFNFPSTYSITTVGDIQLSIIILKRLYPVTTFLFIHETAAVFVIPFKLDPATDYRIHVLQAKEKRHIHCTSFIKSYRLLRCSSSQKFRTLMTVSEIEELYEKATNFIESKQFMTKIHFLYRNKAFFYFIDILQNKNGVMHTYEKNLGGDQASTLNGRLKGLFFSAHLDKRTFLPPNFSYYGPLRFNIPAHCLFNDETNLYFADFYCHYQNHKVMLVITIKGTEADNFCRENLLLLNSYENPFLKLTNAFNFKMVYVSLSITVEVFFTEDIDIGAFLTPYCIPLQKAFIDEVEQVGDGRSMVIGIPKKKDCTICNLERVLKAQTTES